MCRYVVVKEEDGTCIPKKLKKVVRFEAAGNYVNIYLTNGKIYKEQAGNLGLWEDRVEKSGKFVRVNRSNMVHRKAVESFSRAGGVVLKTYPKGKTVPEEQKTRLHLTSNGFIELMWNFIDGDSSDENSEEENPDAAV